MAYTVMACFLSVCRSATQASSVFSYSLGRWAVSEVTLGQTCHNYIGHNYVCRERSDLGADMRIYMCAGMCMNMCVGMCMDMCMDMLADMCVDYVHGEVHRQVKRGV